MKCKTQSAKCSLKNPACSAVHLSETSYTTSHTLSPCPQKSTGRFPAPWTGEPTGMLSVRLYCVLMQFLRRLTPRTASGAWKEASTKQQRMTLSNRMRLGLKGATPCSSFKCSFCSSIASNFYQSFRLVALFRLRSQQHWRRRRL